MQVKIKRLEFTLEVATDGDKTKLFESEFQWLITRLAKKNYDYDFTYIKIATD